MPWNLHEQERGKFDFSRNLDLEYVVQTALLLDTPGLRGGGACRFWVKTLFPASEAGAVLGAKLSFLPLLPGVLGTYRISTGPV